MEQNQTLHSPRFMRESLETELDTKVMSAAFEAIKAAEKLSAPSSTDATNAVATTLTSVRKAAFKALQKSGLPHTHSEDFTFVRLSEFMPFLVESRLIEKTLEDSDKSTLTATKSDAEVEPFIYAEAKSNYLVIENGIWNRESSKIDSNICVTALASNTMELNPHFLRGLENEPDGTASLAALFATKPMHIQFSAGYNSTAPLQILHLSTSHESSNESVSAPSAQALQPTLIFIEVAKNVEAKILVRSEIFADSTEPKTNEKKSNPQFINLNTQVYLNENASLKIFEASKPDQHIHFQKLSAQLSRNSRFKSLAAQSGSTLTRKSYAIDLQGEGAEAEINSASVLMGNRQAHQHILIKHLVPNCNSKQHFKSVAADSAKSSVDGTIFVAENANGTNAHQLINNLMLSDTARTDSKPQLKIYSDDVKCAHGSTTGKLDAAQQFYLESRGLNAEQAKSLLTLAFVAEIVEKCDLDLSHFRSQLEHNLLDALKLKLPTDVQIKTDN